MQEVTHFKIKTEVFEGPLDLLLSLIEKRKLLINDISLAQVTDDYIQYVKQVEEGMNIKTGSHFILIASTLLLIKSKSLLPTLELSEEEQGSIEELEHRLKLYKQYKELSVHIEERFGKKIMFVGGEVRKTVEKFTPSDQISLKSIHEHALSLINTFPKKEKVPKAVVKKVISLEETIQKLTKRIQSGLQMSFKEFAGVGKEEKVNVIVSFLAMLELVKQGLINVKQESHFEDIHMETKNITTPNY